MTTTPHLRGKEDSLRQLREIFGSRLPTSLRLHLGCGEIRLADYINIDFPPSHHTVQKTQAADVFADISLLQFQPEQVAEIRLHHVFEHFDRPTALAFLAAWHQWLSPDGKLVIETPDFKGSMDLMLKPDLSIEQKQVVLRHIFGSHEASWAVHYDGWYDEKYRWILSELGYEISSVEHGEWKLTRNVTVTARRGRTMGRSEIAQRAKNLLRGGMVDDSASEQSLWLQWCARFDEVFNNCSPGTLHPKVSIFVPVYNRQQYLAQTLDSLLGQSFTDFEVVIADDGSTDSTLSIAQAYAARDSRLKVISLPHQGEVATRNAAITHTDPHSTYLLNHDSDDISLATKLETLVNFLDRYPQIAIVGCRAAYFDDQGQNLGVPEIELSPARIRATFGSLNSMINSASLIRRTVFEKVGSYREEYRSVDDYDFFSRALLAGFEMANLPEILHLIRLHPDSVGSTRAALQQDLANRIRENYESQRAGNAA